MENDLLSEPRQQTDDLRSTLFRNVHTRNAFAGAELRYAYKQTFSFTANVTYRHWQTEKEEEEYMLCFKPKVEADIQAMFRPVKAAGVHIGLQAMNHEKYGEMKAASMNNLYAGGSYEFRQGWAVYARAENLLNKSYMYNWGYPAMGINFLGGITFRF